MKSKQIQDTKEIKVQTPINLDPHIQKPLKTEQTKNYQNNGHHRCSNRVFSFGILSEIHLFNNCKQTHGSEKYTPLRLRPMEHIHGHLINKHSINRNGRPVLGLK